MKIQSIIYCMSVRGEKSYKSNEKIREGERESDTETEERERERERESEKENSSSLNLSWDS